MSTGELAFLIMVVGAALVFMGTLAWVSRRTEPKARAPEAHRAGVH